MAVKNFQLSEIRKRIRSENERLHILKMLQWPEDDRKLYT